MLTSAYPRFFQKGGSLSILLYKQQFFALMKFFFNILGKILVFVNHNFFAEEGIERYMVIKNIMCSCE